MAARVWLFRSGRLGDKPCQVVIWWTSFLLFKIVPSEEFLDSSSLIKDFLCIDQISIAPLILLVEFNLSLGGMQVEV